MIDLDPGQRGVLIGMTGTGKSTLMTELIARFLASSQKNRVVVIDSKPRYRATYNVRGMRQRYDNWVAGDTLPDSVAVHALHDLKQLWKLCRCVIVQSMTADGRSVAFFEDLAAQYGEAVFRASGPRQPTLFAIDEYYDVLQGGLAATIDRRLLKTIRAGRERGMAVLVGAQRPRSIPLPTLTEATKLYMFQLEYEDDIKYLEKHGPQLQHQPVGHAFVFYERLPGGRRDERLMELSLRSA